MKKLKPWLLPVVLLIVVIGMWYYFGFQYYHDIGLKDVDDRGTYGDQFGIVTALFSGLAFAGIIYTILLQRDELQLQRNELRDTRKQFEMQNATMALQRKEQTFFHLLNLHNDLVKGLNFETFKGHNIFEMILRRFHSDLFNKNFAEHSALQTYRNHYKVHYVDENVKGVVLHYFASLCSIYRFIKLEFKAKANESTQDFFDALIMSERDRYIEIFKSYITYQELEFLFAHVNLVDKSEPYAAMLTQMTRDFDLLINITEVRDRRDNVSIMSFH